MSYYRNYDTMRVGSVVHVRGVYNSPEMSVRSINWLTGKVTCEWFIGYVSKRATFKARQLSVINHEPHVQL